MFLKRSQLQSELTRCVSASVIIIVGLLRFYDNGRLIPSNETFVTDGEPEEQQTNLDITLEVFRQGVWRPGEYVKILCDSSKS